MILFVLFFTFCTSALFAFGGGLSIIPFLKNISETYQWFSLEELTNVIALAEVTPGALGVNMATYTGYLTAGFWGALVATLALATPSLLFALLLSPVWNRFKDYAIVVSSFNAIKVCVAALILSIFFSLFLPLLNPSFQQVENLKVLSVFCVLLLLLKIKKLPLIFYLLIAGFFGIIIQIF